MSKGRIFLLLNLSFVGGVFLFMLFKMSLVFIYFLGVGFIILAAVFWKEKKVKLIAFLGLFFILGFLRGYLHENKILEEKSAYNSLIDKEVILKGMVSGEIFESEKSSQIVLSRLSLRSAVPSATTALPLPGKILLFAEHGVFYDYGTLLQVKGKVSLAKPFGYFDYPRYLQQQRIYAIIFRPEISAIKENQGNFLLAPTTNILVWGHSQVFKVKDKFKEAAGYILPEPGVSVFKAMTLGLKKEVPKEVKENFRRSGVSHLMAVSGLHVSIIAMILLFLLLGLGLWRKHAFYLALAGIFFFVILVGAPPSAIRAGIMGFLLLLAVHLGRLSRATSAIVFAAAVMLLINPILIETVSFQLSFLATLGIIHLFPLFEKLFLIQVPDILKLKSIFWVTISAQAATLPVIIYHFKEASIIAPLINILVLPVVPFIMTFGLIAVFFYLLAKILGLVLAWPCFLLLEYLLFVVKLGSSFRFAAFEIKNFNLFFLIIYYLALIWLYFYLKKKIREKEKVSL